MANISHTTTFSILDRVLWHGLRALSHVVSLRKLMRSYLDRWTTALIDEESLRRFLGAIGSLDSWPTDALSFVTREETEYRAWEAYLTEEERSRRLRRLSGLCALAQWGCMPLGEEKRACYRR